MSWVEASGLGPKFWLGWEVMASLVHGFCVEWESGSSVRFGWIWVIRQVVGLLG